LHQIIRHSFWLIAVVILSSGCRKDEECLPSQHQDVDSLNDGLSYHDTALVGTFIPFILPCNGHPELCDRRIDEISVAMTHNAHAHSGTFSPLAANQNGDVLAQLNAGIRGLNIKPYWTANGSCGNGSQGLYLYHGSPILGCEPLENFLDVVYDFLTQHPRECIILTIEGDASAQRLDSIFNYTGLSSLMYDHIGGNWPTLAAMISTNKRLVVLSDRQDAESFIGQHRMWSHVVDVNYDNQNISQFDCQFDRGNPEGAFFLLNHFLTNVTPQSGSAGQTNSYGLLYSRALECWNSNSKRPNFIMVDFFATGDVVQVVDSLNLLH
jgi:hypothetical protein